MSEMRKKSTKNNDSQVPRRLKESPLIPTSLVDTAQQRLVVISLFILIQSFKVYDFIVLKNSNSQSKLESPQYINTLFLIGFHDNRLNFMFKYLIIDTLFICVLPILNIPFLNFNKIASLLQIIVMALININLANEVQIPLVSFVLTSIMKMLNIRSRELTILGDTVNSDEVLDHSQYFKGRKTIKFLPDSLVEFNPFENHWCFQDSPLEVPIKFNTSSTGLDFLQLKYISLEDNTVELTNFTSKNLRKLIKSGQKNYYNEIVGQDNIFYIDLPIKKAGYYQVNQVIDNRSMNLKLLNKQLIIPQCPSAKLILTSEELTDLCVNDLVKNDDLLINVIGLPPLKVNYYEAVNGALGDVVTKRLVPSQFKSPLLKSRKFSSKDVANLASWANLRSVNVPVLSDRKLEKAGEYVYTIKSVEDALGNIIEYDDFDLDNSLLYKFNTHHLPIGKLTDFSPSRPLLEGGKKKLNLQLGGIPCQKCDSPYTATVVQYDENQKFVRSFNQSFDLENSRDMSFTVSEPGYYELQRFSSRYCENTNQNNRVHVAQVVRPLVNISSTPIVDACVGTTGFTFNFQVQGGTPPFNLEYKVYRLKDNRQVSIPQVRRIEAKTRNFQHDYKPPIEGNYSIEFTKLRDQYYEESLEESKYKYITYFKQKSKAAVNSNDLQLCHGSSLKIPLVFDGKAPYKLEYKFVKDGELYYSKVVEDIQGAEHVIETPQFTDGGKYELILNNVQDASLCKIDLNKNKVTLHVRKESPMVSFALKSQELLIVEGKSEYVPLKTRGIYSRSVNLRYKLTSPNGLESIENIANFNVERGFPVTREGTYTLLDVLDSQCPGSVTSDTIVVGYLPKPTIKPASTMEGLVCAGANGKQSYQFELQGSGPFSIEYSVHYPNGGVELRLAHSKGKIFELQPESTEPGLFRYIINGVDDSLYTNEVIHNLKRRGSYKFEPIEVKHQVYEIPYALFGGSSDVVPSASSKNKLIQLCSANLDDDASLDPIGIKLSGQLPFSLDMRITSKTKSFKKNFKLSNIEENYIESYDIYKRFQLDVDTYVISLLKIQDANGCVNTNLEEESNTITLRINDVPKIERVVKSLGQSKIESSKFAKLKVNKGEKYSDYYCVGDHVHFQIEGVSPFNVGYKFNEEEHQITNLNTPSFKRLVTKPGVLKIESLSDSSAAKSCRVDLSKTSKEYQIYDLPSVELFQGNVVEEDIHEGDKSELLFSFKGIPPFKLTYTRTTIDDGGHSSKTSKSKNKNKKRGKNDKIIETEVVEGIEGYEYSVWTSAEGIYEAVEVEDSRCRVKNYV